MTFSDYRETYSWQAAIALGPKVIQLAEQLPTSEQMGLGLQLRQAMVALPTSIARDLVNGGRNRFDGALELTAVVELIERIYPALDAGAVHDMLETLMTRLAGETFDERVAAKMVEPVADADEDVEPTPAAAPAEVTLPAPAPTSVPVMPAASEVVITPQPQAPDVHPDSV